ncbi:hypothetical protein CAMSH0001_1282 [Campylobacter showae RM3277]|uniref:Uncharacterized protein n=1 Tax=Campylobacter showae RM3277 TaxID=553219 RepID=C6RDX4_9BACT|nr:hypothetical protein CAMSH0001_1282 [Campylobacter showae RM3277]
MPRLGFQSFVVRWSRFFEDVFALGVWIKSLNLRAPVSSVRSIFL